jgi:Tfp pilus assembly protein PilF
MPVVTEGRFDSPGTGPAAGRSAGRTRWLPLWAAFLLLWPAGTALPQTGGGHTLFGDFKVDDSKLPGPERQIFNVILYDSLGRVAGRQSVAGGGRYSFVGVRNGEYDIVVEAGNEEVARIRVVLTFPLQTDVRNDISLEWRRPRVGLSDDKAAVVRASDFYQRPRATEAGFAGAQEAVKKKEYEQAITLLRQVVAEDPKDFEAWTELGTLHFKRGKAGEAEKLYLRALQERPTFIVALLNLGKLRVERKDYDGAIVVLLRAVKELPQSAEANYFLGEAFLQVKKGSKAVGYLSEAIRLDPAGMAEAHLRLAALYNAAGMKERAAAEYEQFLARRPDHPDRKKIEQYVREHKRP